MVKLKAVVATVTIVVILVAAFAVCAGITYPATVVNTQIFFTVGADTKTTAFVQSFLDDKSQVQVAIQNDAALWRAQTRIDDQVTWEHTATQGDNKPTTAAGFNYPVETTISLSEQ
jgi:hypothetical protein